MTIGGKMIHDCTYEELGVGDIFSFSDERHRIWDSRYNYKSIEEYEANLEKDSLEYEKHEDEYLGEALYMVCWEHESSNVDSEYIFHPKYIDLKTGCIYDMITETEFGEHNYYSPVRVYDTCREIDVNFDEYDDDRNRSSVW